MRVKILRSTVAGGHAVDAGDVVDLDGGEAKFLASIGKAEEFTEEVAPVGPVVEPDPEPEPEPKPARKKYKPRVKK